MLEGRYVGAMADTSTTPQIVQQVRELLDKGELDFKKIRTGLNDLLAAVDDLDRRLKKLEDGLAAVDDFDRRLKKLEDTS
jgi:hypothetical protein